jgi:RNA polymerase sigma factor (sigma-70 family)
MTNAMATDATAVATVACLGPEATPVVGMDARPPIGDGAVVAYAAHDGDGGVPTPTSTFEEVVERYQAEIYRYAVQLTRNRTDADDLYQETLLKAYRAFGRLDGAANHRAWLYRIATNTFLSDRRKLARVDHLDDATAQAIPAAAVDHADGLDARDLLREVAVFVEGLPPKQRVALTLRKYHELDYGEIAAALRSSEPAARASVHAALRKLRERFGDRPAVREVIVGDRLPDRAAADPPIGR